MRTAPRRPAGPPRNAHFLAFSGGGTTGTSSIFGDSWIPALTPRASAPPGRLLDKKYFLPKRRCPRVVRAQKLTEKYGLSGNGSVWEVSSAIARTPRCGQFWPAICPQAQAVPDAFWSFCPRRARLLLYIRGTRCRRCTRRGRSEPPRLSDADGPGGASGPSAPDRILVSARTRRKTRTMLSHRVSEFKARQGAGENPQNSGYLIP